MAELEAYFSEWETEPPEGTDWTRGCATYPVTLSTNHSSSSYGQPVVIIDGEARGCGEMPPGELQIPEGHDEWAERLQRAGYEVCTQRVDEWWLSCWDKATEMEERHWHPEARWVAF